jgi:hypothetical protein
MKPGTVIGTRKPGSPTRSGKSGSGTAKKAGSGTKKPGSTVKKTGSGTRKSSKSAKRPRKPVRPSVKRALLRRGLARSFRNFKYRWWSRRWRSWLFYNPLDAGWYCYAPSCDCFVPADYIAYDPPDECDGPDDDDSGCPQQAMRCPVLTPDDSVDAPDDPSNDPPQLPGVDNDD